MFKPIAPLWQGIAALEMLDDRSNWALTVCPLQTYLNLNHGR